MSLIILFQGIKRVQKEVIEESDKCGPEKKHLVKAKKVLPPVRNNIQTRKSSRKMETIAEEVMSDPDVDMAESESKMAGSESEMAESESQKAGSESKKTGSESKMAGSETKMAGSESKKAESESKMADLLEFENPVIIEPVEDILDIEETNSLPSLLPLSSLFPRRRSSHWP